MATLGKVDEFDANKEEWPHYKEQLTHFFQANNIDDAGKKKAVLLHVCCWPCDIQTAQKSIT